jgi:hypothetical protein
MRPIRSVLLILGGPLLLLLAGLPASADAQLRWGVHGVHATDAFEGTSGAGIRGGLSLPAIPLSAAASWEYFFPSCPAGADGCGLRGATVDLNFEPCVVIPAVRPYVSGGFAWRRFAPGGAAEAQHVTGFTAGAGIQLGTSGFGAFGEGRYEMTDAPDDQLVWRLGILFSLF